MTERLYYTDSYLAVFDSDVLSCEPRRDHFEVALSATAFYPTGGGQPHDLGELGGRRVLDVIDREAEGVVHILDGALSPGTSVKGMIDWPRRFDHMQQHSGQHILSAAFDTITRARTESFHLGTAACTIDLHRLVSPAEITAAEEEANRVVWLDREVSVRFAEGEGPDLGLRKETARAGTLRLIEVTDFDRSACGGTHVARTGAIGIIAVTGWEKFKGGTRIEFVCGGRALARLRAWRDVFAATSRLLSVLPEGLAPAIEKLQGENKALTRAVRDQQEQLAVHKAAELLAATSPDAHGSRTVVEALEGWDTAGLKAIATAAAASANVRIAVFSATTPFVTVVARGAGAALDAAAVLKMLVGRFGGKGGGKPEFAQGGGLEGRIEEVIQAARELLSGNPS